MKIFPVPTFVLSLLCLVFVLGEGRATVHVFGDSLSDTGNFSIITEGQFPPAPLYASGRFTNGPVWVEVLAQALREPTPGPSLTGGTNYAFNGSRAAGVSPYGTPSVMLQVSTFLESCNNQVNANDYFVIWAGANDIFFGAALGETNFVGQALMGIVQSIEALHAAGARRIIVLNLPPLGQTPFFQATPSVAMQLDAAALGFNMALAGALQELGQSSPSLAIAPVDIWGLFQEITRRPRKFRLNNTLIASTLFDVNSGSSLGYALNPSVDPERSLFWDGVHPTARTHEIIGKLAHQITRARLSRGCPR